MLAARSWVESPITLNVVTAIGSILAGVGAVWVALLAGPAYRLYYGPLEGEKLPDGSWRVRIYLSSRGRGDIKRKAFDGGRPVELDLGVPIRRQEDEIWNSRPDVRVVDTRIEDSRLLVGPGLISRRQDLRFTVVAERQPVTVTCQASLNDVRVRRQPLRPRTRSRVAELLAVALLVGVAVLVNRIVASFKVDVQSYLFAAFAAAGALIAMELYRRRVKYPPK